MATTITDALETEVAAIRAIAPPGDEATWPVSLRERLDIDRHFGAVLHLLAPRIRHFIARYRLADMREDAEQACAIAVHRAIADYDPAKARFTTFVNWQLRGELQSLRFRMRLDQRDSARKVGASTVSLALPAGDGEATLGDLIVDEEAERRVTSGARDVFARRAANAMLDDYTDMARRHALDQLERATARANGSSGRRLARPGTPAPHRLAAIEAKIESDRAIAARHLLGGRETAAEGAMSKEQKRQAARRVLRHMAKRVTANERLNLVDPQ
ncbi:sigma-70 family RNA polymerase sigma factor [Altererythrobacter sp. ZODW24]|uniref:sigma-70 family RNA polymerase sigma factor n=1 Tax=Altererythrobacter sp. ZODW24 TaxID=2185142 RepID=UPI000DF7B5D5|nr:sigma-70 family RNA polymerase sigma factor [Altererythrobacter sp. ZODW24]